MTQTPNAVKTAFETMICRDGYLAALLQDLHRRERQGEDTVQEQLELIEAHRRANSR